MPGSRSGALGRARQSDAFVRGLAVLIALVTLLQPVPSMATGKDPAVREATGSSAGTGPANRLAGPAIPVLCYHQVRPGATGKFEISTEAFARQLDLLASRRYQTITTNDLLAALAGKMTLPARPVMLTFDDGFRTVYDHAWPLMKARGFVGVACIYPSLIGSKVAMSWQQLADLASAGWTIEAHSMTHPDLSKLPAEPAERARMLDREIVEPKRIIERAIGRPVRFFTWPYGIYTEETEGVARAAGYEGALTVDAGGNYLGIDPFRIKRQVIYGTDSIEKFEIRLEMGPLVIDSPMPRPGAVVRRVDTIQARLPDLVGRPPATYRVEPKVTGGKLEARFDPATGELVARPSAPLKAGPHFIDIYVRDLQTNMCAQHGWFFVLRP